jgi:hypothetical protein
MMIQIDELILGWFETANHYPIIYIYIIEASLEVKLPTIWTDGKSRGGKSQRGGGKKRQDQRRERVRRKRMQVRER